MTELLSSFIRRCGSRRCVVLTGAGCSTESGVPDYRGPNGLYRRADFKPLMLQEFLSSELEQKRYWARSMLGYSFVTGASCNAAHMGLYALSRAGVVAHILTQNVDGLHHLAAHGGAGSAEETAYPLYTQSEYNVHELHGNIHQVLCMQCKDISPRQRLQRRLREVNDEMCAAHAAEHNMRRPDGDFDAPLSAVRAMRLVSCEACGGLLKPHVVLFGDNVPRRRVEETLSIVREASCLVCLGTSLQVFSAYRYVVAAKESGVPIAIVTNGVTRADGVEDLKIDTPSASNIVQGLSRLLIGGDTM